jgi:hypothetical protein
MSSAAPDLLRRSRAVLFAGSLAAGVLAFGACSKKAPIAQAPPPPLEVPVVPPRLVGPVVVEEPAPTTAEVPEPAPPRQRPPRAVARGNGNGGSEPVVKVEPPPESAKTPDAPGQPSPSATNAEAAPPPLLRTDTADDASVAKSVQETLLRAQQNLDKVNYQALNPGAKAQHDTARRFIAQAQDALKSRRLDFARYLADKADRLSASLLSR